MVAPPPLSLAVAAKDFTICEPKRPGLVELDFVGRILPIGVPIRVVKDAKFSDLVLHIGDFVGDKSFARADYSSTGSYQ